MMSGKVNDRDKTEYEINQGINSKNTIKWMNEDNS